MTDYSELEALISVAVRAEQDLADAGRALERARERYEATNEAAGEAWRAAKAWTFDRISEAAGHMPTP